MNGTDVAEPVAVDAPLDRRTVAVVGVMAAAAFMAVLDGTIVTVAIDSFTSTFDASVATIGWVSVGYLLAAAVSLPVSGWAVERFGGRRVFLVGLALFVVGSLLASVAWSAGALVAFRVVQGFGGGALEPTALTLAARTADGRRVGTVMGFLSLVVNVAPVLGPLLGGLFIEGGHWRWIFLVNVPLGIAVAVVALLVVPDDPGDPGAARSDLKGLGLLSPGFALVLLAIERIGVGAAWWQVAVTAVAGAGLLVWYVARARRVSRPVVDPAMFAHRGFASSVGVMALVGFLMYSLLVALPLYARDVHGREGIAQGVLVTALGVGLLVSMALAARASDVVGPRRLAGPGALVTALGLAVVVVVQDSAGMVVLLPVFVAVGLGFGAVAAPTFSSVYRTVPTDRAAQATTTMFIVVQTSASFGVTVIGLVMSRLGADAYGLLFTILAVDAALMALLSRLLPGAPAAERAPERRAPVVGGTRAPRGANGG
jgi:EmrB/QacA subfamily drug resistance transporter